METCTLSRWSSSIRGCWGSWEGSTLAGGCLEGKPKVWRGRWSRRWCDEEHWVISWHSYWTVSCRSWGWRWEHSRSYKRPSEHDWERAWGFWDCWLRVIPCSGTNTSSSSMSWRGRYVFVCFISFFFLLVYVCVCSKCGDALEEKKNYKNVVQQSHPLIKNILSN